MGFKYTVVYYVLIYPKATMVSFKTVASAFPFTLAFALEHPLHPTIEHLLLQLGMGRLLQRLHQRASVTFATKRTNDFMSQS